MADPFGREDMVVLTQRIIDADGAEAEIGRIIELLERNVPHPAVTGLIFYSGEDRTAEEVVQRALAYRLVQL